MADPLLMGFLLCFWGAVACFVVAALCWVADQMSDHMAAIPADEDFEGDDDL